MDSGRDLTEDIEDIEEIDKSPLGGERPGKVFLPSNYDPSKKYPLLTLLHGYGATSFIQDSFLKVSLLVNDLQFILITPDGLKDGNGQYWNATDACCDFERNKGPTTKLI